jgi:hypothetical protein
MYIPEHRPYYRALAASGCALGATLIAGKLFRGQWFAYRPLAFAAVPLSYGIALSAQGSRPPATAQGDGARRPSKEVPVAEEVEAAVITPEMAAVALVNDTRTDLADLCDAFRRSLEGEKGESADYLRSLTDEQLLATVWAVRTVAGSVPARSPLNPIHSYQWSVDDLTRLDGVVPYVCSEAERGRFGEAAGALAKLRGEHLLRRSHLDSLWPKSLSAGNASLKNLSPLWLALLWANKVKHRGCSLDLRIFIFEPGRYSPDDGRSFIHQVAEEISEEDQQEDFVRTFVGIHGVPDSFSKLMSRSLTAWDPFPHLYEASGGLEVLGRRYPETAGYIVDRIGASDRKRLVEMLAVAVPDPTVLMFKWSDVAPTDAHKKVIAELISRLDDIRSLHDFLYGFNRSLPTETRKFAGDFEKVRGDGFRRLRALWAGLGRPPREGEGQGDLKVVPMDVFTANIAPQLSNGELAAFASSCRMTRAMAAPALILGRAEQMHTARVERHTNRGYNYLVEIMTLPPCYLRGSTHGDLLANLLEQDEPPREDQLEELIRCTNESLGFWHGREALRVMLDRLEDDTDSADTIEAVRAWREKNSA